MDLPAYILNDEPITISAADAAAGIARRFRVRAGSFRQAAGMNHTDVRNSRAVYDLNTACGTDLIGAYDRDLIPDSYPELREVCEFHKAPTPPSNAPAVRLRHPNNLFLDVCDGHTVRFNGPPDEVMGGLMPRYTGRGHLSLPPFERAAMTCEWLADLIERSASDNTPIEALAEPPRARKPPELVERESEIGWRLWLPCV